jgi:MOSC domain-containing protein YiiM
MASAPPPSPTGPRLAGIHVSDGGVPKRPVPEARVTTEGVEGDRQRDLRYHGGPDRAVSLYGQERVAALAAEGHPIAPGSTGENLTLAGVDWGQVTPGTELRVGAAVRLVVTSYAAPCSKIAGSFAGGAYRRASHKIHPGWSRVYARVLSEGTVRTGDPVEVVAPTHRPRP